MAHRKAGAFHHPLTQGAADRAQALPSSADESKYYARQTGLISQLDTPSALGACTARSHNPAEPFRYQEQNRRESSLGLDKSKWHTGLNRRTCRLQHFLYSTGAGGRDFDFHFHGF